MAFDHLPYLNSYITVRYAGDVLDARQVDGKIWFAVDGQAILTRAEHRRHISELNLAPGTPTHAAASIHVVLGKSRSGNEASPAGRVSTPGYSSPEESALLMKAAQVNQTFAAVTALPPGIHMMCFVPPSTGDAGGKRAESVGKWSALWEDFRAGTGPAEEAKRLTWQTPCLSLLHNAGSFLESTAILSLAGSVPSTGWALVPCARSINVVCELASGGGMGDGGNVAWLHIGTDGKEAASDAATAVALVDSLLLTSDTKTELAYASVSARNLGIAEVEVATAAHGVLPGGVLSGYDVSPASPTAREEPHKSADKRPDSETPKTVEDALFVDESTALVDGGQSWRGTVAVEKLPGGGLHRRMRVKVDVNCAGKACGGLSLRRAEQESEGSEWCEVLLAQHVPQGVYIDVDEVKARHKFDVRSTPPTGRTVDVETFEGEPIDVELPSSVSGQHAVNFNMWVDMSNRDRSREGEASIQAEMTLPVHLRYPDPGCERRAEVCPGYTWVQVPPPLVSIRCGRPGDTGQFSAVRPAIPPVGVTLSVPHGIAWHRDFVMLGTTGAAALGCLYTVYTLLSVVPMGFAYGSDRKRR